MYLIIIYNMILLWYNTVQNSIPILQIVTSFSRKNDEY